MHKARRLLSRLRKQPSAGVDSTAQLSVQEPGANTAQMRESGENPDEVNVRINNQILQEAIEWAMLLDGSRGASDDDSSKRSLQHGPQSLAKKLGLGFFIDLIPGGRLLVCAPLSYFKVYRPLLQLNIPEERRAALRTTMRKCMAIDCGMGAFYLLGAVPRHFFGSNHRMTQEGRRWVFEHADICNQGFSDLYALQGSTPDSLSERSHSPMIQQVKHGKTRSVLGSYCERKPVGPVQPVQPASASGHQHPPQKAEWRGTLDDQLYYLLYTPEQIVDTRAARSSSVTEAPSIASESGTVQTSPPPPGEQPRRFVQNKRFSEKLYNPAAAARNAFYYHAAANSLERSINHHAMQHASSTKKDGFKTHHRQPPPVPLQRVSKSPIRNTKRGTYVVGSQQWTLYESQLEQPRTGFLQDAGAQEKSIRRPGFEEPLHIRRPRPLRVSPRMRNKDIPFTGPLLLRSAIPKSGMPAQSTFRPPYVAAGSTSVRLSNGIIATATYSGAEF